MEAVVGDRDLVCCIIRALREAAVEHQEGWKPKRGCTFHICVGGFAFARAGMMCKLWRDVVNELWTSDALNVSAVALWKVRENMEVAGGACDGESEDEDDSLDEDAPSWRRAEPALIVGVKTTYTELREALLPGRRFFLRLEIREDGKRYIPRGGLDGKSSTRIDEPLPPPEERDEDIQEVHTVQDIYSGNLWLKYHLPDRCHEISHELAAEGSLWVPRLFCIGGENEAADEVVVGVLVGEVHWRTCEALIDLPGTDRYAHENFFDAEDDVEELMDPFAPDHSAFYNALRPLAREAIRQFWRQADPQHGDLHERLLEPSFYVCGQAGNQHHKKSVLARD
mmetsp:Transcript_18038/g.57652  ORF Transcript_18038/g.57652 Transcript_18038/m.57652 type:complete len:339 (-) Transcript_18038:121-1137(-)